MHGDRQSVEFNPDNTFAFPGDGLDLEMTVAPVAWGKGRWPSVDWIDGELVQIRRSAISPELGLIRVRQDGAGSLLVSGFQAQSDAAEWLRATLGWQRTPPEMADPVVALHAARFSGMRPYSHGCSLAQALMTVIIGQGVTVQGGAVLERRLASLHSPGLEYAGRAFYPFPSAEQLATTPIEQVRSTGLTGRRAEGIVQIARLELEGSVPGVADAHEYPEQTIARLRQLPMVGPWSAAAALLWGIGSDDAHVTGDVALLRAARLAYERPEMTLKELDVLAEAWRPNRAWAARWLWLHLLGPAPSARSD